MSTHRLFIIILTVLFALLSITTYYLWYAPINTNRIRHNDAFDKETNTAIINLINQAMGVQFNRYGRAMADDIFTEKFQQSLDENRPQLYNRGFFIGLIETICRD